MAKAKEPVQDFVQASKRVADFFGSEGDFFLKPLLDLEWTIRRDDDFYFLCYWLENDKKVEAVIVKKNGEPLIYRTKDYSMVVAIDCVKIGFVFRNGKRASELRQ
ncbi:hypothetical protein CLNEO_23180 [Anaerotignum neopropionicum]|uniref:Uncharacterized protein n=1 Tax=Anaerotignum neopropionicum TaxID=36847 RepID=A0A136WD21_9FIRM|nr:hypothetical protein [Anaerotignum neopropionicum]KXL52384.1 hypothetical protein CLNEO_23180 [Anaerotignum neopropionicum]